MKAYSVLSEANDRAVAIYGPVSTWHKDEQCAYEINYCWMKRIGEFMKISKFLLKFMKIFKFLKKFLKIFKFLSKFLNIFKFL